MQRAQPTTRVLVVEDEPGIRSALQEYLEGAGYVVDLAQSGTEVTEILPRVRPDVVITDLVLPGMNGLEVARFVRSVPETARIPIIAVTASWLGSKPDWLMEAGFDAALRKPFHPSALLETLNRLFPPPSSSELLH